MVFMWGFLLCSGTDVRHIFKHTKHSKHYYFQLKGEKFMNTWAVIVHGDERMASRVAAENGFVRKGKVRGFDCTRLVTGLNLWGTQGPGNIDRGEGGEKY